MAAPDVNQIVEYDTVLGIDDSGSMSSYWPFTTELLQRVVDIVIPVDEDGPDVYFMNHRSAQDAGAPSGKGVGGYYGIQDASEVDEIFRNVRPRGGTPLKELLARILDPWFAEYQKDQAIPRLNVLVLTDGEPNSEQAVIEYLNLFNARLDRANVHPRAVGVMIFQVGKERDATDFLDRLDNHLKSEKRDLVEVVSASQLATDDDVRRAVIGAVKKKLH